MTGLCSCQSEMYNLCDVVVMIGLRSCRSELYNLCDVVK